MDAPPDASPSEKVIDRRDADAIDAEVPQTPTPTGADGPLTAVSEESTLE